MNNQIAPSPEPTRPAADRHGGLPGSLREVAQWALNTPDRAVGDLKVEVLRESAKCVFVPVPKTSGR